MGDRVDDSLSWWVGLDRAAFLERLKREEVRLRQLTHDRKLQPRGPTERPKTGQGRLPDEEV